MEHIKLSVLSNTLIRIKYSLVASLLVLLILSSCAPTQEISRSWVNRNALPKTPFHSVFVMALVQEKNRSAIENKMEKVMSSRGFKVVKSTDVISGGNSAISKFTKEQLTKLIKDSGCESLYTIAVKNIKTERIYEKMDKTQEVPTHQIWEPIIEYTPIEFGYYGIYFNYISNYENQVYSPNNYVIDRTYFVETNFYDMSSEGLLWSIQSKAFNPTDLDSWFKGYSKLMGKKLRDEGLIRK